MLEANFCRDNNNNDNGEKSIETITIHTANMFEQMLRLYLVCHGMVGGSKRVLVCVSGMYMSYRSNRTIRG